MHALGKIELWSTTSPGTNINYRGKNTDAVDRIASNIGWRFPVSLGSNASVVEGHRSRIERCRKNEAQPPDGRRLGQ